MNWLTLDDLKNEYGEDDFPLDDSNQPNIARVSNAINDSKFFVEGYLRKGGVSLPISAEVFGQVRKAGLVVTRYYYSFGAELISEELIREYGTMQKFLSDIATGKTILSDGDSSKSKGGIRNMNIFIL